MSETHPDFEKIGETSVDIRLKTEDEAQMG